MYSKSVQFRSGRRSSGVRDLAEHEERLPRAKKPRMDAGAAMESRALEFFNTLTDAQRDMLASMGGMTAQERSELGDALVATATASQATGVASGLEDLKAAGGTGPAFVAFGERAVTHRYISQQQLDRIANRLTLYPTAEDREAETVKAMRRFIAARQPLSEVRLVGCPVRHKSAPKVDLNGLRARMDLMSSMPGGTPDRYNVNVKLPGTGRRVRRRRRRRRPVPHCGGRTQAPAAGTARGGSP